jgi:hypothetical protein
MKFWRTLETLAKPAAVLAEWQGLIGDEFGRAKAFIVATRRHTDTYPCTRVPSCGQRHEIETDEAGGKLRAVSRSKAVKCLPIPLQPPDLLVHELDVVTLCATIRTALGFDAAAANGFNLSSRSHSVGIHAPSRSPVLLTLAHSESVLLREIETLLAMVAAPFILLTPTPTHCTIRVEGVLRRNNCTAIPLSTVLQLCGRSRFKQCGRIDGVLAAFEQKLGGGSRESKSDERKSVGRLSYLPGFDQVWLGGQLYDLSERPKARACIQFLVDRKAVDRTSACHLEKEIDPHVRAKCQLPKLPNYSETKIHYYFNPTKSKTARLGRELIRSAGRGTGRYFLNVQ